MVLLFYLCPGAPKESTGSCSSFKASQNLKSHPTDWESWESNSGFLGTR